MSNTVDARGLSCPQPVLMIHDEMKRVSGGEIEILVDTETSKENVIRAAESKGWEVADISSDNGGFKILVKKG